MAELLTDDQVRDALADLPEWQGDATALRRSASAPDFLRGIRWVVAVAEVAEAMNHHPDIDIRWTTVTLRLSTHSAGGVTANDVDLARRIEQVLTAEAT